MITFDKPVKFGLIGGLALITFSVLMYAMDVSIFNPVFAIVNILVNFGVIIFLAVLAINKMRDADFGGKISYIQALIAGFITLLIASYILTFFTYILNGVIDPEYMPRIVDDFLLNMEGKVPEETFEELMNTMNESIDPMKSLLKSLWITPITAIVISAIVSIFVTKNTTDQIA
jgi:hypothetical protein